MPTFGFSAFLKLACLNPRPIRTELRGRLSGAGGGYDFHRSLRLRASRYLVDGEAMEDVLASAQEIVRAPEQASVRVGLERLASWRKTYPGPVLTYPPATYESPTGLYKVTFAPDFGFAFGGENVAIHIWNTARPRLVPRLVYAALSLMLPQYAEIEACPDDLALLSLPESRLYRLSEAGRFAALGAGLASRIEDLIRDVEDEVRRPDERPSDRP